MIAELPGFPDNLAADADGIVWVALASEPNPTLEVMHKLPLFLRRLAARLPESVQPKPSRVAWVAAYDENGACVHDFKWTDGGFCDGDWRLPCRPSHVVRWPPRTRIDALRLARLRKRRSLFPQPRFAHAFKNGLKLG